jgi:two-component system cell cycle sensor histidine kinase/response regulator CckA
VNEATRRVPDCEALADRGAATPAGATVLLVDDEAATRRLFRLALERRGFTVLEAGGGAEALRAVVRHPGAIDLLATDVDLPELDGCALARQLCLMRPGLRVLYLSGYGKECLSERGAEESAAFLQKPFAHEALERKVRELLGRAA